MTREATERTTTGSADCVVREMRWWDIEPVMELEKDLFPQDAWSRGMFWSELAHSRGAQANRCYVVAEENGRIVGYAGLVASGEQALLADRDIRRVEERRSPEVRRRPWLDKVHDSALPGQNRFRASGTPRHGTCRPCAYGPAPRGKPSIDEV